MCYTDNSADHAEVFLNAQLSSLWENATACLKKLDPQHRLDATPNRYSVALAKYVVGRSRPGTSWPQDFEATFNKPSLRFVCNHDVILRLTIVEGQYTISSSENGRSTPVTGRSGRYKTLKDVEVHFRIPFQRSGIQGGLSMVGARHDGVILLSLDFTAPQLHYICPSVEECDRETVTQQLKGYLKLLQRAGHHILFSLPEFNDAGLHYTVDFSSAVEKFTGVDTVLGVPTKKINDFLAAAWLNAVILSGTSDEPSATGTGLALAEYRSTWSPRNFGIHFHISFSAPTVVALCDREVLITFNIQSVSFFDGAHLGSDAPLQTFTDWKFSFLSTVEYEQSQGGGNVLRFVMDQANYHYMEHFSQFSGYDADCDTHDLKSRLKEFFVTEYLIRIEREELHTLYDSDVVFFFPGAVGGDELEDQDNVGDDDNDTDSEGDNHPKRLSGGSTAKIVIREEVSTTSDVGVFDLVSAVSQAAVNLHFRSSWEQSRTKQTTWSSMVTKWTHSEVFEAEFKPITARLLSNERAIVVIRMESGYLKVGKDSFDRDAEPHAFSHWSLAFEVPLAKCRHADIPGVNSSWATRFQESFAYKEHGKANDREFYHIYANFKDAEFVPTFSQFTGLFSSGVQRESIIKVKALLTLVREQYFPLLMTAGYHVVHTIPIWKGGNAQVGALTDFHFRVSSETVVTRKTLKGRSHHSDPVIVIAGVTGGRALPQLRLDLPMHWLVRLGRIMRSGAVCLSRSVFLNPKVLELFSAVNAMTTMVPFFTGLNGPNWGLRLVPWAEDEDRKHVFTNFKLEENTGVEDELRYDWQHEARWTYEQLGSSWSSQQKYIASCHTTNRLIIPTTYKHGSLDIQIEGRIELRTGYGIDQPNAWIARAAVNWSSNLLVRTHQGCLYVSVDSARPIYESKVLEGNHIDHICDPEDLLRKHFTKSPDLACVAALFRHFEEPWKLSYPGDGAFNLTHPVFNKRGDLLFELHPFVARGPPPTIRPKPQRRFTLKQAFGPSDFVLPRGRPERPIFREPVPSFPEHPQGQDRRRGDYSGSRTRGPANGRASPAQQGLGGQAYQQGSEERVFQSHLRIPGNAIPNAHRSHANTPIHSRPASPRQAHFHTESDTAMLRQSFSPREAGNFAYATYTQTVDSSPPQFPAADTKPAYFTTSPTGYSSYDVPQ